MNRHFESMSFLTHGQWASPTVYISLTLAIILLICFVVVELRFAAEPMLPPTLLTMKVPMLVGPASFMVSMCNFAVMYNLPTWFQTVMLTSASEAGMRSSAEAFLDLPAHGFHSLGAHLIPNGISLAMGSLFAGYVIGPSILFIEDDAKYGHSWMMHKTGKYRVLTLICGIFPFVSAVMIATMRENSHPLLQWLGIVGHDTSKSGIH